jgi:hypothetical protein
MSIGIELLKDYFAPLRPGQVAGIVGQTSHYKSGLLHLIEHEGVKQLEEQKREDEAIIHVSVEECVEEQAFLEFARGTEEEASKLANGQVKDWDKLIRISYEAGKHPIYYVGDSLGRSDDIPALYMTNIIRAIRHIVDQFGVRVAMIGVDYLQAIPADPELRKMDFETQRRLQVRSDAYRLRQMASQFTCPVWVAAQAKQRLEGFSDQPKGPVLYIPGMYDVNESADVPQRFDRMIATWLPCRTYPIGTKIKIGRVELVVEENLLLIKVNKQRGGLPAGRVFVCEIEYRSNTIIPKYDLETQR